MIRKCIWLAIAVSVLGFATASGARADDWNRKTVLTFSQPVEIPGMVLPAGTYTFKLADSASDRHVVQVFTADGSQILATFMTIPDYRLTATDQTVMKFRETPSGSPDAIRAWFHPGSSVGEEFVYPKPRALALAKAAKEVVPAIVAEASDVDALKAAPIVAITPDEQEMPLAAVIRTKPLESTFSHTVAATGTNGGARRQLPSTASPLMLIALFGLGCIGVAAGLTLYGRRSLAPTR